MSRKRIVITGIGAVTPLANDVQNLWRRLCQGDSGIGPITIFDASRFPTTIAGEVKNFDFSKWFSKDQDLKFVGRNSRFALGAAEQATTDAGFKNSKINPERLGIYFGAGDGGFDFPKYVDVVANSMDKEGFEIDPYLYIEQTRQKLNPKALLEQEPNQVINHLSHFFNAKGPVFNCLTACAASSQAIGEAAEIIRHGEADVMITGGAHSMIHPLGLGGFNLLTALSTQNQTPTTASKPFDKDRDGFVLSEGSGVLILEELEHAKKRGAKIYAELVGYGGSADAFRLTDPCSDGRGAIQAMKLALQDAQLEAGAIDYINAHGTSTQLNDQVETLAVKTILGDAAKKTPVSSIKSMLGHMIAAAGAVEIISSVLTIREGVIPPTINYHTKDEACDLDYVPNQAREQKVNTVLSNSFGFGGQNITLIVKKFTD